MAYTKTYKDSVEKEAVSVWWLTVLYIVTVIIGAPAYIGLTSEWYSTFIFYSIVILLTVSIAVSINNYKWTFYVFAISILFPHFLFMFYLENPPWLFPILSFLLGIQFFYNTHIVKEK